MSTQFKLPPTRRGMIYIYKTGSGWIRKLLSVPSDEVDYSVSVIKWKPVIYIVNVQITCIIGHVIVPTFHVCFTSSHAGSKQKYLSPSRRKEMQSKRNAER